MDPAFKINKVTKSFGKHTVLDNIQFDIRPGEIIGLIGSSGSGKTTLLSTIIGFIKPEQGKIEFSDHFITKQKPKYWNVQSIHTKLKRLYGFAAQQPSFYPTLTVQENLKYFGSMYDLTEESIAKNTETLLKLMNLTDFRHLPAQNLSGGMERRLDIACSLIHNPAVLILDEPTADLDPVLRNQIWDLIKRINRRGTTIILASHHLSELETLCNRVAILKHGKVLDIGSPYEIKRKHAKHKRIILETYPGEYEKIKRVRTIGIEKIEEDHGRLIIYTANPERILRDLIPHLEKLKETIVDLNVITSSLDDIFINLTGDKK